MFNFSSIWVNWVTTIAVAIVVAILLASHKETRHTSWNLGIYPRMGPVAHSLGYASWHRFAGCQEAVTRRLTNCDSTCSVLLLDTRISWSCYYYDV